MNICFAIGTLSYSGAEKIMYHLLREMQLRGHDVSVLLLSCDKPYTDKLLKKIHQFPADDIQEENIKNKYVRVLRREARIRSVLNSNNFDLLVSFGVKFNVDIAESCFRTKTRLILCERNDPIYDPKSKIQRLRRWISYRRADGFVFQTDEVKAYFSNAIQRRATVIPNLIEELDNFVIDEGRRLSFATCARLDDNQKCQSDLIRGFSAFSRNHPEYSLELFGDGPDREKYVKLIQQLGMEKQIILHGRIEHPMEAIKHCTGFVLTSKYEGMPNALIEAMAYGMPCISTDCSGGGAKALIKNGKNGILIPRNDQAALVKAMEYIADHREEAEKMGREAKKIKEELKKERIVSQWETYFMSVVKSNQCMR